MPTDIRTDLEIRISLLDATPEIWRKFIVSSDVALPELHDLVQIVMGWDNCHLHAFTKDQITYGEPDPDFDDESTTNELGVRIGSLLTEIGRSLVYEYDFGDGWTHELRLEEIRKSSGRRALCLDGARACPPEDVGGIFGYVEFLQALGDSTHAQHSDYTTWIGFDFDSEHFSTEKVNEDIDEYVRRGA